MRRLLLALALALASYLPAEAACDFFAAGGEAQSAAAITPALPASIATDDILLLVLMTSNEAITIPTPNGGTWTEVTDSPQGTGTAGTAAAVRLTVFWSRYNGTQGNPTTSDSGDLNYGAILAFRGCETSGDPWDVTSGGTEAVSDTSVSVTGDTTTVDNTLVVVIAADSTSDVAARSTGEANTDLGSLTEQFDNGTTSGNDGGLVVWTGTKASAGTYGATTATLDNASLKGFMTIALKPPSGGGPTCPKTLAMLGVGC